MKILADRLSLSKATVSKALRDSYEISEETKRRVLEMAAQLDYTPNPYASSLRRKKSKTIAVVLPEVADNFFSLAINGIQSIAEVKGYHVLICLSHEKFENEKEILTEFLSGRVDGVLISISGETNTTEHIAKLQSKNLPVVFFDRRFGNTATAAVITNDKECGYLAARHLLEKGCRNIAFLSVSNCLPICVERLEGYTSALQETGSKTKKPQIFYCNGTEKENYNQVKKLLQGKNRPDGIIASVEKTAILVYLVCQELGIHIPRDLKVIAFSTLETAPILNPPLTTITQPAFDIGKTAATLLFRGIEKKNSDISTECIVLPSVLIERESTRNPDVP